MTVTERILRYNANRLPDKLPIKYKLLAEDPFRFFRGTCHLFYEDLAGVPLPSSPLVWMCGDLHFENFGSFKGDNRLVYFDMNDFDEGILGPAAWELARMLTSLFTGLSVLEFPSRQVQSLAQVFVDRYTAVLSKGKALHIEAATARGVVRAFLKKVEDRSQKSLLAERTEKHKKGRVLATDEEKYFALPEALKKALIRHISAWEASPQGRPGNWTVTDACFRVAGTGSIGLRRYTFLLQHSRHLKLYRLLDMKEVQPSALTPYLTIEQPAWKTEGERVTAIKYRMQSTSPSLMSTTVFDGVSYRLQELQPSEDRLDVALLKEDKDDLERLINYMALLTASAQLRASGRQGSATADELIRFGQRTEWQQPLLDYARQYSRQVERDWSGFRKEELVGR